jgi:hypothetical protein
VAVDGELDVEFVAGNGEGKEIGGLFEGIGKGGTFAEDGETLVEEVEDEDAGLEESARAPAKAPLTGRF